MESQDFQCGQKQIWPLRSKGWPADDLCEMDSYAQDLIWQDAGFEAPTAVKRKWDSHSALKKWHCSLDCWLPLFCYDFGYSLTTGLNPISLMNAMATYCLSTASSLWRLQLQRLHNSKRLNLTHVRTSAKADACTTFQQKWLQYVPLALTL
jgi:hypothetical protein